MAQRSLVHTPLCNGNCWKTRIASTIGWLKLYVVNSCRVNTCCACQSNDGKQSSSRDNKANAIYDVGLRNKRESFGVPKKGRTCRAYVPFCPTKEKLPAANQRSFASFTLCAAADRFVNSKPDKEPVRRCAEAINSDNGP